MILEFYVSKNTEIRKQYRLITRSNIEGFITEILPVLEPTKEKFYNKKLLKTSILEKYILVFSKEVKNLTFEELDGFFSEVGSNFPEFLI